MRFLSLCSVFSLFLILSGNLPAQDVRYIFPDIGAAGMNTYVEIVAAHNSARPFGRDSIYMNGPTDALRVEPTGFLADKVVVGPLVVSWDGRLISTQIFVRPDVTATGTGQLRVTYPGSPTPATLDFEIVTPVPLTLSTGGAIGSGGAYRTRSKRGAMIVQSLSILSGGSYTVSTTDADPGTAGNQGFLPLVIISQTSAILGPVTLDVSAGGRDGGAGGGGGGGQVCDSDFSGNGADGTSGGNGFTAGGGGGRNNAGAVTGFPVFGDSSCVYKSRGSGSGGSGTGLNGVPAGLGSQECAHPEGGGGGTGHPFGRSGENFCMGATGWYGGASTRGQGAGAGGGGYRLDGNNGSGGSNTRGRGYGNSQLVPLAGGSGGASGNPQAPLGDCGGSGGGGGGAIAIYAMGRIQNQATIRANGASGENRSNNADGGSGSGGAVVIGGKDDATNAANLTQMFVNGGPGAGTGGQGSVGRVRFDGFRAGADPASPPNNPSIYYGPSIAPFNYTSQPAFTISGTRDAASTIRIYMRSENGTWARQGNPTYNGRLWNLDLTADQGGGNYYIVALQEVAGANSNQYTAVPGLVTSQVAANIVKVDAVPMIDTVHPDFSLGQFGYRGPCPGVFTRTVLRFKSVGGDSLRVEAQIVNESTPGTFQVTSPVEITTPPGKKYASDPSVEIPITIDANATGGVQTGTLRIITNDPRPGFNIIELPLRVEVARTQIEVLRDTIDFGKVCITTSKTDSARIRYRGDALQFNITDLVDPARPFYKIRPADGNEPKFPNPTQRPDYDSIVSIVAQFRPDVVGQFFDSIMVVDECEREYVIYLKGEGIQVKLDIVDPPSATGGILQFPRTVTGRTTRQVIKIANSGGSPVTFTDPVITPTGSAYTIIDPSPVKGIVLQPGDTLEVTIEFAPDTVGLYNGDFLQLNVEGPCNAIDPIDLRGQGVDVCLQATPDMFDLVADSCSVDPAPVTQVVTLKNCGGVIIDILEGDGINGKVTTDLTPRQLTTQSENSRITTFTATWDPASGTGTDSIAVVWREKDAARQDTIWIAVTLKFDRAVVDLQKVNGDPVPDTLDIGGVYQCGPARDTIVLINAGTVEGDVTGRFETGGLFEVFPPPPYRLPIGDTTQLIITLDPSRAPDVGTTYRDVFILENSRCNRQWKVDLKSTRYQLEVDVANYNFGATNLGLPRTATVPLRNATQLAPATEGMVIESIYIDPPSASPPFAIENAPALPVRLQAGGGGLGGLLSVDLSFTPDQEQVYTGRLCFQISEPCDTLICIDLRGEGIRSNIYVPQSNLDFGNVNYCEEDTLGLTIYSVGPIDLTVNDIRLVGGDIAGFEIISVSKPTPVTLASGVPDIIDSIDVRIRFIPANVPPDGVKTTMLEIESDDPRQGLLQIPISGTRTSPQVVGPPLVSYGTVVVSGSSTQVVTLTNTSEDTIRITNPATLTSAFRLVTPAPLVIPPNSSIDVRVEFIPTGSQTYNDTLVGSFNLPCFGEMRVPLTGEGLQGETVISIPKTVAGEPGQEILIPIVLEEAQAIADVGATTLQIDLRFNGSMLLPLDVQFTNGTAKAAAASGNIISDGLEGEDRVVRIELKNDPLPAAPDTLGWMKAVVLLGNSVTTPISLEDPVWTDGEVVTTTDDGEFTLQGYCNVGGDRLIRVEGLFGIKTVAPNPFGEETEIEFETVENGRTSLEIFDLHGRRVATLLDVSDLPVQAHIAVWNAEPHPAGVYYAVLTTPTQRSVRRMVVVK